MYYDVYKGHSSVAGDGMRLWKTLEGLPMGILRHVRTPLALLEPRAQDSTDLRRMEVIF